MNKTIKTIVGIINEAEYNIKTLVGSSASTITGILIFLYNEYIGIFHRVAWCIAIGVYYLLLALTRGMIVINSRRKELKKTSQEKIFIQTHVLLLVVNLSLIAPITIMIRGEKSYAFGLIPAIIMATYTTYRITMSIIHYKKTRKNYNLLIGAIRFINLIDSMVAILTLQNTLIIVITGEISSGMKELSIVSSSGIWITIMLLTILQLVKKKKLIDEIEV